MIPILIIFAIAGIGFAVYETSPKVHGYVTDHVAAIRAAQDAHAEADAHADQVQAALDVSTAAPANDSGVDLHTHAADKLSQSNGANKKAADLTGKAAPTATTPEQRASTAQSAAQVWDRAQANDFKMKNLLIQMTVSGKYARHTYAATADVKDRFLSKVAPVTGFLKGASTRTSAKGNNPWTVTLNGLQLIVFWVQSEQELSVLVPTDNSTPKGGEYNPGSLATRALAANIGARLDAIMAELRQ
jgi:hypothetical protein